MTDPRILVLIPARMAATRLPGKPLADIAGLPMIVHVMRRAEAAGIGRVAVATDTDEIASVVTAHGGEAVMTRPTHPSGSDRIYEAMQKLDPEGQAEIVINLQGDFPTITPQTIREVLPPFGDPAVDIVTLASQIHTEEEDLAPSVVKAIGTSLGGRALMYYLIAYAAMSFGSFAVVAARERELARPVSFEELNGLGWERPGLGAAMTLFMFGFIGLPPAGLFIGKFYAFSAAVDRGWAWLAIVGAVATVVSIYYYLGVVRAMYFQPARLTVAPAGGSPPRDLALGTSVLLSVVVTIGSFVAAQPLLDIARDAVAVLQFPH